ncbi:hypothetical protein BH23THE1_BH23THE1_10830 [soil metagenome]
MVDSVVKDGPDYAAGIEGSDQLPNGDIMTALDGISIRNVHDLLSYIENNKRRVKKLLFRYIKTKKSPISVQRWEKDRFRCILRYMYHHKPHYFRDRLIIAEKGN